MADEAPFPQRPASPGVSAYTFARSPRVTAGAAADANSKHRPVGQDQFYAQAGGSVAEWGITNPRRYSSAFMSEHRRLSQISHPTQIATMQPLVWQPPTAELSPGTYNKDVPGTYSELQRYAKRTAANGRDMSEDSLRTSAFRSVSPQHSLFSDPTQTPSFARSRARTLGPGSYEHTATVPRACSRQPLSSLASRSPQRARLWRAVSADIDTPPVRHRGPPTSPGAAGHTWARALRGTQRGMPPREPGHDAFYASGPSDYGSIAWNLASAGGLHHDHRTGERIHRYKFN